MVMKMLLIAKLKQKLNGDNIMKCSKCNKEIIKIYYQCLCIDCYMETKKDYDKTQKILR